MHSPSGQVLISRVTGNLKSTRTVSAMLGPSRRVLTHMPDSMPAVACGAVLHMPRLSILRMLPWLFGACHGLSCSGCEATGLSSRLRELLSAPQGAAG